MINADTPIRLAKFKNLASLFIEPFLTIIKNKKAPLFSRAPGIFISQLTLKRQF